jgi:hypothetical protein
MTMLTVQDRIAQAETALNEGRIIQGDWRRKNGGGRELVCALAAFGPDINSASDCPAELMPQWLAELVPVLDDGIAAADVPWFMGALLTRAKVWSILDDAGMGSHPHRIYDRPRPSGARQRGAGPAGPEAGILAADCRRRRARRGGAGKGRSRGDQAG